jgi:beta-phosphoglucomutase family hydrolase
VGDKRTRLPPAIRACLFDLDGVIVSSVGTHAAAWKDAFDEFLREQARESGTPFVPFDADHDYALYVDGMRREDGVRTFLASRGITLPEGTPDDPPGRRTVWGVGNRKNALLLSRIESRGVDVYPGSVEFVHAVRADGLSTAIVSSSANAPAMLRAAKIDDLFDVRIDGAYALAKRLAGKPAPDTFLAAAAELGVEPSGAAVFEDALAGVEAGRAGQFAWVIGVDRRGDADALSSHGADVVVSDLAELLADAA